MKLLQETGDTIYCPTADIFAQKLHCSVVQFKRHNSVVYLYSIFIHEPTPPPPSPVVTYIIIEDKKDFLYL